MSEHASSASSRYVIPTTALGKLTNGFFNSLVAASAKAGLSLKGSRVLYVRGRASGEWRTTPVNPLRYQGASYLVAPRGQTQWVRNMRVAGGGGLPIGRRGGKVTATPPAAPREPGTPRP